MHKVQTLSCAKSAKVFAQKGDRQFGLQGQQTVNAEDRVVKVAAPGTVLETAVVVLLAEEEFPDQAG
jgi:hypothetical protein